MHQDLNLLFNLFLIFTFLCQYANRQNCDFLNYLMKCAQMFSKAKYVNNCLCDYTIELLLLLGTSTENMDLYFAYILVNYCVNIR